MSNLFLFCIGSIFLVWIFVLVFAISLVKSGHDADMKRWQAFADMTGKSFTIDGITITSGSAVVHEE